MRLLLASMMKNDMRLLLRVRHIAAVLLAGLTILLTGGPAAMAADQADETVTVFAAASLKNALDDVAKAYRRQDSKVHLRISYAGSSTLARQIQNGAPADLFISANERWMDQLAEDDLLDKASRRDVLGNSLVLIAPRDSDVHLKLDKDTELPKLLGRDRLAMADTQAVPAGMYGKQALQWLHVWSQLQGHIAQSDDVRAALALVSRQETPLGIVYASDAVADKHVRIVATFPEQSHKPIIYPAALLADSKSRQARDFLHFLGTSKARRIFKHWGFAVGSDDDEHQDD